MKKESLGKKVDGRNRALQTGHVGDPPPLKPEPLPEVLTDEQVIEKRVLQRVMKKLIPEFPIKKLEKQSLSDLWRFFEPCSSLVQEEVLTKYKDISP